MRGFALIGLLAFAGSAGAADIPPAEYAYQALALVDMGTTIDLAQRRGQYREMSSPLFGSHPSRGRVIATFTVGSALHYGVTMAMEHAGASQRTVNIWEAVTIGIEAGCVARNYSIGLRFKL